MDTDTYKEITKNIDRKTLNKLQKLVEKHESTLTKKEADYLCNFESKTSNFYGLPKIHKSQEIVQAVNNQRSSYIRITRPQDLKFRPIVAGPACPTHRLSNLLDILLKPFLKHVKSFVRDDIDLLTKLPERIKENETFATFDITSLYSNISNELGREAIHYWIQTYPQTLHPRFNSDFILDSIQLVLENNAFSFGEKNFLQVQGTAMGTKMAPTYANLTLAYLEVSLYGRIQEKYSDTFANHFQNTWKRYLDDCLIIWNKEVDDIHSLHNELNSLHPKLSFTMEYSDEQIPFLDILLLRDGEQIITDIYHKPTDTKQYLHFKSCHPRSTKINIPYNLARRICTIVTKPTLRQQRLLEMKSHLVQRGYPTQLIEDGMKKASEMSIEMLRRPNEKLQENTCTLVTTHNPNNLNMWNIVQDSILVLQTDARCQRVLDQVQIINSKRQPPNLKKLLTKAKHNTALPTVSTCTDKRCGTCSFLITGPHYTFKGSNQPFYVRTSMNCATENVLYVLECQGCKENYIGQTSDSLRTRMRVHKQQIYNAEYRQIAASKHFADCAGNLTTPFKVYPFYKIMTMDKSFRDIKEQTFIRKFKPVLNR